MLDEFFGAGLIMELLASTARTLAAITFLTGPAMAEDYWIKTSSQNCEIWSDRAISEDDRITWTGDCVDGKTNGSGLLIWTQNGKIHARYQGKMAGGKMQGKGVLVEPAASGSGFDVVAGAFEDGVLNGRATYKSAEGAIFMGSFKDNQIHGDALWIEPDGSSFAGEFVNGAAQGTGSSISADGEFYQGDFVSNDRHGHGTVIFPDGGKYTGEFRQDEMTGLARYDDPSGDHYIGSFSNGAPDGPGLFVSAAGDTYQGVFKMGQLDGQVLVTRKDGSQMVETWENGEKKQ